MLSLIALSFATIFLLALYFLYIKPKRVMSNFALAAQSRGYKTKLLPFHFLNYYIGKYFTKDKFSLKVLKEDWSKYDIIVGNNFFGLGIMIGKPELIKDVLNQMYKLEKNSFIT